MKDKGRNMWIQKRIWAWFYYLNLHQGNYLYGLWTDEAAWYKSVESKLQESDWAKLPSLCLRGGFPCGSVVKHLPVTQEMQELWVWWLSQKDLLEEGMTTHSSFLAWRMPWTEKPGRQQSIGLQRVGYNWSNWVPMHVCLGMHGYRVLQKVCSTPELHPDSLQDFLFFQKWIFINSKLKKYLFLLLLLHSKRPV